MEKLLEDRRRAQSLRKNQTKEENHLWYDFLKTYPVQFRRQYAVGPFFVDFYCHRAKLAVELDGSKHYEPEEQEYDRKRTQFLNQQGILVLRFANSDVWKNFSGVCETIDVCVKERIEG